VDDGLLPIGMFSRASSLSIKALRAYHEGGILVPAQVDGRTGYRSYTVDQLGDAAIIRRLRDLDVPLEHVREVLHARDPELTRQVLARHAVTMQARLAETERIVAELQSGLAAQTHTPVHVREEPAVETVRVSGAVDEAEWADWLGWAFGRLTAVLAGAGIAPVGSAAGLYVPEILDDGPQPLEALLPVAGAFALPAGEADVGFGEVPAARVAVLVHAGAYDDIGDTYRALGAWVARHAEPTGERIREWYVVGPSETADAAAWRTEIAWPIAAGSEPITPTGANR
jgi:DNA-binding transcriptional MerR regulator/effector-binding domain-containing protein